MKNGILLSFSAIIFLFFCLFIFLRIQGSIPFVIQNINTNKDNLFSVTGTGEVTTIPDTAMVSLGVTKTSPTVEEAKNQVNTIANKITQDLEKLGINVKDIKTTNYSINQQYDYTSQRITGYTVDTNISVKIKPIEKANNAIDIATKDGANQVGGIQFTIDDSRKKQLLNEARIKAVNEAKEKAQSLTNAANMHLGKIIDISESPQNNNRAYPVMMTAENDKAASAPTQLNPGENTISTTITLSYEIY